MPNCAFLSGQSKCMNLVALISIIHWTWYRSDSIPIAFSLSLPLDSFQFYLSLLLGFCASAILQTNSLPCQPQTNSHYFWTDLEIKWFNLCMCFFFFFKICYPIYVRNKWICMCVFVVYSSTKPLHWWKWDHRYFWNDLIPFFYVLSSETHCTHRHKEKKTIKFNETENASFCGDDRQVRCSRSGNGVWTRKHTRVHSRQKN